VNGRPIRALLFDFDGTLVDSAPDLAAAANAMRECRGLAPVGYDMLRCRAGSGARGMLAGAFGIAPGDERYEPMRREFLDTYEPLMLCSSRLFDAVPALLAALGRRGLPWGIVTNKAMRFAGPMVATLGLQPAVLVAGDTTPHTKPHPAPLLHAALAMGVEPAECVYVGDDRRDMLAARAAGMQAWAAAWGYLGEGVGTADLPAWAPDAIVVDAMAVLQTLDRP
jgi:N-acetyl-D-muramate 6-phosphate phosphatase